MTDKLTYEGYTAQITFNGEYEIFYGRVLNIPETVIFEGTSIKKLKKAFREAVVDYGVAVCIRKGQISISD